MYVSVQNRGRRFATWAEGNTILLQLLLPKDPLVLLILQRQRAVCLNPVVTSFRHANIMQLFYSNFHFVLQKIYDTGTAISADGKKIINPIALFKQL